MFKLVSSLFKYILWFAAVVLLVGYTAERGFVEKCAFIVAAVIVIDAIFLLIEVVYNAVRSTKRVGAKLKKRSRDRSIARAEKRGAKRGAKNARGKQTEQTVIDKISGVFKNND